MELYPAFRKHETYIHIENRTHTCVAALFKTAKNWNNPNSHQPVNKQNVVDPKMKYF